MAPSTSRCRRRRGTSSMRWRMLPRRVSRRMNSRLLGESAARFPARVSRRRPPSAASKSAVESGTVRYGGTSLKLTESIREVTIAASAKLALNEVQFGAMIRRCVDEDSRADADRVRRRSGGAPDHLLLPRASQPAEVRPPAVRSRHRRAGGPSERPRARQPRAPTFATGSRKTSSPVSARARGTTARGRATFHPSSPASGRVSPRGVEADARVRAPDVLRPEHQVHVDSFAQWRRAFEAGHAVARPPSLRRARAGTARRWVEIRLRRRRPRTSSPRRTPFARCARRILVEALDLEGCGDRAAAIPSETSGASSPPMRRRRLRRAALDEVAKALEAVASDAVHGPVLLAWATLVAARRDPRRRRSGGRVVVFRRIAALAGGGSARAAATRASRRRRSSASIFSGGGGGVSVTLHKSVLKNLLTATLAAFDILPAHKLRPRARHAPRRARGARRGAADPCASSFGAARNPTVSRRPFSRSSWGVKRDTRRTPRRCSARWRRSRGAPRGGVRARVSSRASRRWRYPRPPATSSRRARCSPWAPTDVSRRWEEAMEAWREDREAWSRRRETGYARRRRTPASRRRFPGTSRAASLEALTLPGACVPRGTLGRAIPRSGTSVRVRRGGTGGGGRRRRGDDGGGGSARRRSGRGYRGLNAPPPLRARIRRASLRLVRRG